MTFSIDNLLIFILFYVIKIYNYHDLKSGTFGMNNTKFYILVRLYTHF